MLNHYFIFPLIRDWAKTNTARKQDDTWNKGLFMPNSNLSVISVADVYIPHCGHPSALGPLSKEAHSCARAAINKVPHTELPKQQKCVVSVLEALARLGGKVASF